MKKALIFWGGWDGHEPEKVSKIFKGLLEKEDYSVEVSDSLEVLEEDGKLTDLDLLAPIWTMGEIKKEQVQAVSEAVANGTGLAGCHGGMCDAFRNNVLWQFITGGNWVSHPGGDGVEYTVNIKNSSSPLVDGIRDFKVSSEQYYLHVDPAVEVLATTRFPVVHWFHSTNREMDMPVVWTKRWGHGRIYYNSLGHHADIFDIPEAIELMRRGLVWAGEGKAITKAKGGSSEDFKSDKKMF